MAEPRSRGPAPPAPGPKVSVIPDSTTTSIAARGDVADLEVERGWRRLRLAATVPVPCGPGPCMCYGHQLGGSA